MVVLVTLGRLRPLLVVGGGGLVVGVVHTMNDDVGVRVEASGAIRLPLAELLVEELVEIEALHLGLFADAQVHIWDVLEGVQEDAADDKRVGRDGGDFGELLADLHAVAVDAAGVETHAVEGGDGLVGEDAGEEGAHHAADAVELEDVEALVDAHPFVDVLAQGAYDSCEESDDGCEPDTARTNVSQQFEAILVEGGLTRRNLRRV